MGSKECGIHFRDELSDVLGHQVRISKVDAVRVLREPPGVAAANSQREFTMTGHLTEIILLGVLASAVVLGVLELCWTIWERGNPAASNRTE